MTELLSFSCDITCVWVALLAFLPSMLWLLFFWRQDRHPEPKRIVARIFIWGMLIAIPIVVVEGLLGEFFVPILGISLIWVFQFLGVALIEEIGKYGVVRFKAIPLKAFDEPQDAVIYMVTAALGFAAIENVFYALSVYEYGFTASIYAIGGRFLTANLLHIIASGTVGYGIAYARFTRFSHRHLVIISLGIATILHGLYNHFIIQAHVTRVLSLPLASLVILVGGGILIIVAYRHMRSWPTYTS